MKNIFNGKISNFVECNTILLYDNELQHAKRKQAYC